MTKIGIDVSYSQGKVDWAKVKKSGVEFVILRAGYGREASQVDDTFEANYSGCKAVGLPVGVYWYSYAEDEEDAVKEAKACLEVIKGKQFEYPIYFDPERDFQFNNGKSFVSKISKAFIKTIEDKGYYGGLYTNANWIRNVIDSDLQENYTVWLAAYTGDINDKPDYDGQYGMWQFSSKGNIEGIGPYVDLDLCYSDYPTKIKSKGLNGFPKDLKGDANNDGKVDVRDAAKIASDLSKGKKPSKQADFNGDGKVDVRDAAAIARALSKPKNKSIDEIASEVIQGMWGNGSVRKANLIKAGYDYNAVQEAVNKMIYGG